MDFFKEVFVGGMIERREKKGCRLNFWALTKVLRNMLHNVLRKT
jgi:hypothetical protein